MTEPDQIEFHERVDVAASKPDAPSIPARVGIVVGSAALVIVGAVAAMGASPTSSSSDRQAALSAAAPAAGTVEAPEAHGGFRGGLFGRGGFRDITIEGISGSNLSLKTDDGWTRTIAVGGSTTITKGGQAIAIGDLAVGDRIRFAQDRAADGTYTITAIHVVLPSLGGEVTAVGDNSITVTAKDGTTGTIHVDGDTTYEVNGSSGKALSDITVGSFVVAEGTLRTDGSLDADAVHGGQRGLRDGNRGWPGFPDKDGDPDATATPAPSSTAS